MHKMHGFACVLPTLHPPPAPVRQVNFIWLLTYMITLHIILAALYTDHVEINEFESTLLVATKNNNHLTVFRPH